MELRRNIIARLIFMYLLRPADGGGLHQLHELHKSQNNAHSERLSKDRRDSVGTNSIRAHALHG